MECTPIIQFGDNTIEKLSAVVPEAQQMCCALTVYGNYLYVVGGGKGAYASFATKTITKVNLKTGSSQTLSVTIPEERSSAFYATVNNKLYILGGFSKSTNAALSTVYIFDPSTETVSTGTPLSTQIKRDGNTLINSCAVVGNKIYILGYLTSTATTRFDILVYDTSDGSTTNTGKNTLGGAAACAAVNNTIYAFGGLNASGGYIQKYFKYDISTNTVTQLGSYVFNYNAASAVGKYVYIFHGFYGSLQNVIQRYDTETDTFENLSITTSIKCAYRQAITSGTNIYICTGNSTAINAANNVVEKFSVNSPLTENHLFLQQDFGTDGLWSALKSKDTDLKVKVINAYLGDSNNIAQLTNAYLYDTASNQWKSLSGESYVADMQNALNILGVN